MLSSFGVFSQCDLKLSGEVIDFHDGSPLLGATVEVLDTNLKAYTGLDGKFTVTGLCPGKVTLQVSHPECTSVLLDVEISGNTFKKIRLEHHLEQLGEVIVTENGLPQKTKSAQETLIKTETIERYSAANLGDALKEISGVSSINTGSTIVKPVIQGLHSSRIITMSNGVRLQDQEWGIEHSPTLDLNASGNITVIKGAAALQYGGDAVGGVIVAEPSKISPVDSLFGKTILSGATNGRGGALTTSLVRSYKSGWYASAQATVKRFGDFEAPDYQLTNTGYFEKAFSVSVGKNNFKQGLEAYYSFFNNEIGILRSAHLGNTEDLLRAINSGVPQVINPFSYDINAPKQDVTHHLGKLRFYNRFEGLGKLTAQYDFQLNNRKEFDIRRGEDRNKPALDMELTTHTLTGDFAFDAVHGFTVNAGVLARYQTNFPDPDTGVQRLIPDYDRYEAGLYITAAKKVTEKTTLDAGMRYDFMFIDAQKFYNKNRWQSLGYDEDFSDIIVEDFGTQWLTNPRFTFHNFSGTLGLTHQLNNNLELKANYALANRAPNPSELFSDGLHHSTATIELGDLRIEQETAHKFSASIEKSKGNFTFSLAPYANIINNFILIEPTDAELTIRGAFPVWEYRQVDAQMFGVDVDLAYKFHQNIEYSGRFSYVYAEDKSRNRPIIDIPAANIANRLSFSKPAWKNLNVTLRSDYFFRQNRFPNNNFNINVIENGELIEKEVDISTPPAAYHLLGLDAFATFPVFNQNKLTIGIIANNILNEKYRDYLNRLRFFADDLGRNIQIQLKFNY